MSSRDLGWDDTEKRVPFVTDSIIIRVGFFNNFRVLMNFFTAVSGSLSRYFLGLVVVVGCLLGLVGRWVDGRWFLGRWTMIRGFLGHFGPFGP